MIYRIFTLSLILFFNHNTSASISSGGLSAQGLRQASDAASFDKSDVFEIVSETSLFQNSYSVSRVSGHDSSAIVSIKIDKPKTYSQINSYLSSHIGLKGDDLDVVTKINVKVEHAIINWLAMLRESGFNGEQKLRLAKAADNLRYKQLTFLAKLKYLNRLMEEIALNERSSWDRGNMIDGINGEISRVIENFNHYINLITNKET